MLMGRSHQDSAVPCRPGKIKGRSSRNVVRLHTVFCRTGYPGGIRVDESAEACTRTSCGHGRNRINKAWYRVKVSYEHHAVFCKTAGAGLPTAQRCGARRKSARQRSPDLFGNTQPEVADALPEADPTSPHRSPGGQRISRLNAPNWPCRFSSRRKIPLKARYWPVWTNGWARSNCC